jgi:endonuclease/exonuclease/phosphatase family metal-dependent hydrolase
MNTLKAMTYNIHYGVGRDGRYDLDRIIDIIAAENPDVLTLQEVDNNVLRTNFDNQPRRVAEALDMNYYHCINRPVDTGEFGIATLSKFPFIHTERFDISYRRRLEPRGALRTDIQLDRKNRLHVFNVHFGLRPWERRFQRRQLLSNRILRHATIRFPVIVMGDFNDQIPSVVHGGFRSYLADPCMNLTRLKKTTFSWGPFRLRLDHIYIDRRLHAVESYVVRNSSALQASDHLPVITRISLPHKGAV